MVICSLAGRVRLLAFSGFPTRLLNSKSKISLGQKMQMPIVTRTQLQMPIVARTSLMTRISASFSHLQVNEYIDFSAALHSCQSRALASNSDKGATQDGVVAATGGEEDQGVNSKGGDNGGEAGKGPGDGGEAELKKDIKRLESSIKQLEEMRQLIWDKKKPSDLERQEAISLTNEIASKGNEIASKGNILAELIKKENSQVKPAADSLPAPTAWTRPKLLCSSAGKKWDFQRPLDWIAAINKDGFLGQYEAWKNKTQDKQYRKFYFITGAPGTGKSRSLDEFPGILRVAAANTDSIELQDRLKTMFVFSVSLENGTQNNGNLSPNSYVPARMAYQLYSNEMGWDAFKDKSVAKTVKVCDIEKMLTKFSGTANASDLTILILIDGVQNLAYEKLSEMMSSLTDTLFSSDGAFYLMAFSGTVRLPFDRVVGISKVPVVRLRTGLIDGSHIIGQYAGDPIKEILVQDMGGHGRALEILQVELEANPRAKVKLIMTEVKSKLYNRYPELDALADTHRIPLLATILSGKRLELTDKIPGTDMIVDDVSGRGLFRYDVCTQRLTVPYVWIWIMCERSPFPLLQNLDFCDYDKLEDKLESGTSDQLSFRYFERICCILRALRSHTFANDEVWDWRGLHYGAVFGSNSSVKVVNRHLLSVEVATRQFRTRSSFLGSSFLGRILLNYLPSRSRVRTNAVFLNASSAEAGDALVRLSLADGSRVNEALQMRRYDSKNIVTAKMVREERRKAADIGDLFVLYSNGKVDKSQVPDRTAIVDAEVFEEYFGPFAARAFVFGTEFPLNVNTATRYQLELCKNVGKVRAEDILKARKTGPFKDADEMKERVTSLRLSEKDMKQFKFSDA